MGIGAPGSVDVDTGTVLYANNLEFDNVPLGQMIHERTGLPVYVDNDANVAAWGEYCAGAGKGSSSMVMVTLGTGVGGGVVLNGKLLTGCNGAAAELGHFVIDMHGKECNCGMRGCFEQYGSVTALICQAREPWPPIRRASSGRWRKTRKPTSTARSSCCLRRGRRDRRAGGQHLCTLPLRRRDEHHQHLPTRGALPGRRHQPPQRRTGRADPGVNAAHGYGRSCPKQPRIMSAELFGDAGIIGAALLGKGK